MFNRENFIKVIPKPSNQDIIVYDISLKELIDVNVPLEYNNLYPMFIEEKNKYIQLKEEIKEYKNFIDNAYMIHPGWDEKQYLEKLSNEKKIYSSYFYDIKKAETQIDVLNKKLNAIHEKIEVEKIKSSKEISERIENINEGIKLNKEKVSNYKIILSSYNQSLKTIKNSINENEDTFKLLSEMVEQIDSNIFKCPLCNSKVKNHSEDSLLYKRILRKIEQNKNELTELISNKKNIETSISYYKEEYEKAKAKLDNDLNFKKDSKLIYNKKSLNLLQLEAESDKILNEISNLKEKIANSKDIHSKKYIETKDSIKRLEISLENFRKIKEYKFNIQDKLKEYDILNASLKTKSDTIKKYIKFLTIYYKIYEQKANEFCGLDYKFKFFKVDGYKINETFELKYKGIDYFQLNIKEKEKVDKYLINKFSLFD